jgi:uncharacterized protein YciI
MKTLYTILLCFGILLTSSAVYAQSTRVPYDSTLAKKLNADENGMKKYIMVFLKTGTVTDLPKTTTDSLFAGHMQNIGRLADSGKLVLAGPFFKNDKYRGIFILNTDSLEEARQLVETDPVIKAKVLDVEMLLWYGSASLGETPEIHKRIQKKGH